MLDIEQGSLDYFLAQPVDARWAGLLGVLAEELASQMPAPEIKAFFAVLGRRWARRMPLSGGSDLKEFEKAANVAFASCHWGWLRIRDLSNCIELQHSCSPLRSAFGPEAMSWAPGLLEGLYDEWLRVQGAGRDLVLRQVGRVEGPADTLRFRLASAEYFA